MSDVPASRDVDVQRLSWSRNEPGVCAEGGSRRGRPPGPSGASGLPPDGPSPPGRGVRPVLAPRMRGTRRWPAPGRSRRGRHLWCGDARPARLVPGACRGNPYSHGGADNRVKLICFPLLTRLESAARARSSAASLRDLLAVRRWSGKPVMKLTRHARHPSRCPRCHPASPPSMTDSVAPIRCAGELSAVERRISPTRNPSGGRQ